jgi:hypothetical protein
MSTYYDHLIELHLLEEELKQHLPKEQERQEVMNIFDSTIHHVVLDVVFQKIPIEVHELFLVRFHAEPAASHHLSFLRQYAPDIDEHIREAAAFHRKQFIDTIHA